ncbi:MAG: ADOP family duplicated permease [Acidobacteriota bacterium]
MSLLSRFANIFRAGRLNRDLDEEFPSHLQEAIGQGRDPGEARRASDSTLRHRETSRDIKTAGWADSLRADAVFGWRQLRKHKVTSAAAILSLGLALGACTAAFQLMDALFLRPLPVSDPQRLYAISRPGGGSGDGWEHMRFRRMRTAMKDHADLIAISFPEQTDLTYAAAGAGQAMEKAYVQYVSGWMFRSFGLRPAQGRLLTEGDDPEPGAHPVAVLSYNYWTSRFARDPNVVGSRVTIARKYGVGSDIFDIVGVAGEAFTGTEPGTETEVFVPAMMHPLASLPVAALFRVFVRLPPDVAPGPVHDHLDAVLHALNQQDGKNFPYRKNQVLLMESAASGVSGMQKNYGPALAALGVLVLLVLLIACANVANLLSAQAAARAREMALRVSIGAGRARLLQLVLVESTILALAAAAAGAVVAWQATPFVVARINPPDSPARLSLAGDWRVFGFGLALTLAVTLLLGLAPALRASAVRPASALRGGEDPRSRGRLMHVLVALQAAFCFLVLFISGLFAVTFDRLIHQPAGFAAEGLIALDTVTPRDEAPSAWKQVAEHLQSVPGVESVAVSEWPLLDGNGYRLNDVSIGGGSPTDTVVRFLIVSSGWIGTMKIPLIAGRDLRADETGAALVNREFARQYFPGKDPVGQWFDAVPGGQWGRHFQVVGVVGDTRYRKVRDPILPVAYIPYTGPWHVESLIVRVSPSAGATTPLALASVLRREVSRARPGFRVTAIRTQEGMLQAQTVRERLLAMLALFFAVIALLLAGVGLYGVLDYSVLQRRREIGIRMAIGAQAVDIARRVTFDIIAWVFAGSLAGFALAVGFARYSESLLYQVKATDWSSLAAPALALTAAAILAALPPVIRAVRIDPARVLQSQ